MILFEKRNWLNETVVVSVIRDLQIGVQVQDRVRVQVSNFNSVAFSEPSLLPVADQLKRRLSVRDWREM